MGVEFAVKAAVLEPIECVGPGGGNGCQVCHLQLDERVGEEQTTKVTRKLDLGKHDVGEVWQTKDD